MGRYEQPTEGFEYKKVSRKKVKVSKKGTVGKDQEKVQSEKDSHSKNRDINNQVLIP